MKKQYRWLKQKVRWEDWLPGYMVFTGFVGLAASLSLAVERFAQLEDPDRVFLCDINPILSCSSVMVSEQASLFGVPHAFLGIAAFSALLTLGVLLLADARLKQWLWWCVLGAATAGFLGVQYLVYQSIFVLQTLCPWCIAIWLSVVPLFVGVVSYIHRRKLLKVKQSLFKKIIKFISQHGDGLLVVWFVLLLQLIVVQFWYFWSTLI